MNPEDPTCGQCGKSYGKPIMATISSSGHVQTYQACPYCMTKVRDAKQPKNEKVKATILSKTTSTQKAPELDGKCGQYFGYLNKRPKGTPIPETCLTCEKMVECMCG
jgi:DNA-directed RNA polymerase subunit RPC12/RpoP